MYFDAAEAPATAAVAAFIALVAADEAASAAAEAAPMVAEAAVSTAEAAVETAAAADAVASAAGVVAASSFFWQAARATAATRVANRSDFFMEFLEEKFEQLPVILDTCPRKQALLTKGQQAKLEHFLCLAHNYTHP